MKRRTRVVIAMSALAASFAFSASAQPSATDAALAIQLYEDAEKLMTAGDPAAACPKYAESQRYDPQLGTLLHLADCYEQIGKLASAWAGYKQVAEIAARRNVMGGYEPRERVARARAAALEAKLSMVVIHVTEPDLAGLEIRRDGAASREPLTRQISHVVAIASDRPQDENDDLPIFQIDDVPGITDFVITHLRLASTS